MLKPKKKTAKRKSIKRRNPESKINDLKSLDGEIVKVEFSKDEADWQVGGRLKCWYDNNGRFKYYSISVGSYQKDSWGSVSFTDLNIYSARNEYLTENSTLPRIQLK